MLFIASIMVSIIGECLRPSKIAELLLSWHKKKNVYMFEVLFSRLYNRNQNSTQTNIQYPLS